VCSHQLCWHKPVRLCVHRHTLHATTPAQNKCAHILAHSFGNIFGDGLKQEQLPLHALDHERSLRLKADWPKSFELKSHSHIQQQKRLRGRMASARTLHRKAAQRGILEQGSHRSHRKGSEAAFWIAQKLCESAGKLGTSQPTDTAQKIWLPVLRLCDNAY